MLAAGDGDGGQLGELRVAFVVVGRERLLQPGEVILDQTLGAPLHPFGVEAVEPLGEESFRLTLESPVGRIEPAVRILERDSRSISWIYTSAIEGGGRVDISPDTDGGCLVAYTGEFHLKRKFLDRAACLVGVERFARSNGERSLKRLKHLMEARRY